jgi:hypothetical protein
MIRNFRPVGWFYENVSLIKRVPTTSRNDSLLRPGYREDSGSGAKAWLWHMDGWVRFVPVEQPFKGRCLQPCDCSPGRSVASQFK